MKYKLPRQVFSKDVTEMAIRNIRRTKEKIKKTTPTQIRELATICKTIKKKGLPSHLVCKKLSKKLGFGIFLDPKAKPIEKGEIIASYSGEVRIVAQYEEDDSAYAFESLTHMTLTKEEQKRYDPKKKYHPNRLYVILVDAAKKGNFTRFINHSDKPNVEADLLSIPKNRSGLALSPIEVVYVAKKRILPGEQLLIYYDGDDNSYWGVLNIKPFPMTPRTFRL